MSATASVDPAPPPPHGAWRQRAVGLRLTLSNCSPQDWLVLTYLLILNMVLLPRVAHPNYGPSAVRMAGLLGFFLLVLVPVRTRLLRDGFFAPLGYRVAIQGTVQTSYFFFPAFLPLVNPRSFDHELYALDLRLFGFEPSIELERHVSPLTSEWFAFFYFCYFLLLALHTLPIVLFVRRERLLGEFTLGMLVLFCVGHVCYMAVPGFGPVKALEALWTSSFPSGLWIDTVMETVKNGGAQKDIFPSLHTAAPTFITLFSFRHRRAYPFRYSWPIVGFFTVNIVAATMFLRWHWLIDVVAGVLLACAGFYLSIRVTDWDIERRQAKGLGPSWPRFSLPKSEAPLRQH